MADNSKFNPEKVRVIVKSSPFIPDKQIPEIQKIGKLKHVMKSVNAYSLDVPLKDINKLKTISWVKDVKISQKKIPSKN